MAHILVVDDEARVREAICRLLESKGHTVSAAGSGEQALEVTGQHSPDLIVMDITLPGIDGVETLRRLRERGVESVAIFMTAYGSVRSAVDAMRAGGFDYLSKPFDNDDLMITVERGLRLRALDKRVAGLEEDLRARTAFAGIVGQSAAIQSVLRDLAKVAQSSTTVLLLGESGTGKELAAKSLHRQSPRARGPFVAINCGAITPTLAESELFGHERGAFTDARESRGGKFEQAQRGTLFLDEVGELTLDLQTKLLRVIQEREVVRVGGRQSIPLDVRIVAATNRDLQSAVAAGRFRDDLYWRLSVFPIALPALRDRREDIPLLIDNLLDHLNAELGLKVVGLSAAALNEMLAYSWPGNVRELANVLRRAMIVTESSVIESSDLLLQRPTQSSPHDAAAGAETGSLVDAVARATDRIERTMIESALAEAKGNRSEAAIILGINRRTLFTKMRRLQLTLDDVDQG